jgi:hypothetical protein
MELIKLDADQAFWDYARLRGDVPWELKQLVETDRIVTNPERVEEVLRYLHDDLGMRDDDTPNVRTPIRVLGDASAR